MVLVSRSHQRQSGVKALRMQVILNGNVRIEVLHPKCHRVIDNVVATARKQHRVPNTPGRAPSSELFDDQFALIDAEHEAHFVPRLGEIQNRDTQ